MHGEWPEAMTDEEKQEVWNNAIEHCVRLNCTCEAVLRTEVVGLVFTSMGPGVAQGISIEHSQNCYASGRNN